MAVNCCVDPRAMLGVVGSISMDAKVALVTFSMVVPETLPSVAVIVVLPAATGEANPLLPIESLIVATVFLEEFQVTEPVTF